jgi:hypothetical protein
MKCLSETEQVLWGLSRGVRLTLILVLSPFRFEMWYRTPSKSETVMSMDSFLSLKEMNDVRCGVLILTAHWISHWFSLLLATINLNRNEMGLVINLCLHRQITRPHPELPACFFFLMKLTPLVHFLF